MSKRIEARVEEITSELVERGLTRQQAADLLLRLWDPNTRPAAEEELKRLYDIEINLEDFGLLPPTLN